MWRVMSPPWGPIPWTTHSVVTQPATVIPIWQLAFRGGEVRMGRRMSHEASVRNSGPPADPKEDGAERAVKPGVNVPNAPQQAVAEASSAAADLSDSITTSIKSTVTAVKRAMGIEEQKLSKDDIHGAAGTLEYAPMKETLPPGGAATDRRHADAKYSEIREKEKPHFPDDQESVNKMFPDAAEAASLQNLGASQQDGVKRKKSNTLETNLHDTGP